MDQTPPSHNSDSPNTESKGARSENQPEWFAKVNNENGVTVGESGDSKNNRRRLVPLVAALAIVSAAAAYGLNKSSDSAHSVEDSTTLSSLPIAGIFGSLNLRLSHWITAGGMSDSRENLNKAKQQTGYVVAHDGLLKSNFCTHCTLP